MPENKIQCPKCSADMPIDVLSAKADDVLTCAHCGSKTQLTGDGWAKKDEAIDGLKRQLEALAEKLRGKK